MIRLDPHLVIATVTVRTTGGKRRARVLRGPRLRAVIDLRGLRAQRVVVLIEGRTRGGRSRRSARTYVSCAPHRS
jgi:hypothetical protein